MQSTNLKPDPARVRHIVDLAAGKHALVRGAQDRIDELRQARDNKRRDRVAAMGDERTFGAEHVKTRQATFDKAIADLEALLAEAQSDLKRLSDEWQSSSRLKMAVVDHARRNGIFVHGDDYSGTFAEQMGTAKQVSNNDA
jgi:hypothetical protein